MAVNRIRGAFQVPRKGETFELRAGLVSQYAYERKESIQKTIMAMTLGKDVSALFPDVLKNIATGDLDQKKLVYLYLMFVNSTCAHVSELRLCTNVAVGTMRSHIPTCVSLLSIPLSKIPKTQTP
jgi:vesicle coat complex subunit